ncbi:serine--tRNA ligase [Candidatus Amesbacteria bacterium RIFCSPHIGHO2_02_FULL_48_21]|uniref:Serine--tRNA ligase n=1 Tax=Candidatus Amesbacteria bacterium GW2011_GWA2_47_11 TaxID=1618357 RepID=A0A0G1UH06_9BACT|nr:MAG: Serine-tRNA ligase [Candidatus Amesbacteria bacterium GW2011_GWA2_47_11]OGC95904.1 MAG: serine--tRNA ligase [Candidatus Amesbacteria bacterium RIFCSPHIGHO2_02_FULL_48_21]OGD01435.1 MAG: serine--tRNA ligase [Candidatus Amesbacteria bacterium RIFOXYB1_FULL_47_12]
MLDIKLIREQSDLVKKGVSAKGYDPDLVDQAQKLDTQYRRHLHASEILRASRNTLTKDQLTEGKKLKTELKQIESEADKTKSQLEEILSQIPNLPRPEAPLGKNETENVEVRKWGVPRKFDFQPKDHLELGKYLNILDFVTGAKVVGSQFYYWYGDGALLELALVRFTFDLLQKEGFLPVITPDLAKARYYLGTGYMPKGNEAQTYTIEGEDLGLIATAEVTLAGKHADEIIPVQNLPIKYIGYSHCFRQEQGAYGKYSKGLYRVHQFTKAEMFIYCTPEESDKYHLHILDMEEKIYQALGLPYRVLEMCTGDLGGMAARKFDIEAWMPTRGDYGEVTSTSNCTDYQARNLNIRFKRQNGAIDFIHMLNGTAIATSRTPLAILENYQNADGSVTIPEVLRPYMGHDKITPRK